MKRAINLFNKEFYIPFFEKIGKATKSFSLTEKLIFSVFALIFIGSTLTMLLKVNNQFLVEIPRSGGTLKEGVVGSPRFINPLLALSETDRDLTSLTYSGLMRLTSDGKLIPDLAESYSVSEDGLTYTFILREDAKFHDGTQVTTDDIIFTIVTAQDPVIKSSKRANWDGVVIEKINEREINFILNQAYSPFLNNTTLGILPRHIWQSVSPEEFAFSQFNSEPIGSGPYEIKKIEKDKSGIAKSYTLDAFSDFTLGKPYIKKVVFNFYRNQTALLEALESGEINSVNSIAANEAKRLEEEGFRVLRFPLPRIFGVFFNQSEAPILVSKSVRSALNAAIDRQKIIDQVLAGYGRTANGPIPPSLIPFETLTDSGNQSEEKNYTEEAIKILNDANWEVNEDGFMQRKTSDGTELLSFSLTTVNVPELVSVAENVVEAWKSIGADVNLKVFDTNDLNQNVIRPRNYDALLFGEIIGRDLDFYAFWHSSQRNDPGLNIADYANITVDHALEDARELSDEPERIEKFITFNSEVRKDIPAAFIYSPDFIYVVPKDLKGIVPENITTPSERFSSIYSWYLETDKVWKIFDNK